MNVLQVTTVAEDNSGTTFKTLVCSGLYTVVDLSNVQSGTVERPTGANCLIIAKGFIDDPLFVSESFATLQSLIKLL